MAAMTKPMIPHRGAEFEQLFERLQQGLKPVFKTNRPVLVNSSSATGMMEAGIRALPAGRDALSRQRCVLRAVRVHRDDVRARGGPVRGALGAGARSSAARGTTVDPEVRRDHGGAFRDIDRCARTMCARCRTPRTGTECSVSSTASAASAAPSCSFDDWKLDYVLTGSQKAFALPPGTLLCRRIGGADRSRAERPGTRRLLRSGGARRLCAAKPDAEHAGDLPALCARGAAASRWQIGRHRGSAGRDTRRWRRERSNGSPR